MFSCPRASTGYPVILDKKEIITDVGKHLKVTQVKKLMYPFMAVSNSTGAGVVLRLTMSIRSVTRGILGPVQRGAASFLLL